MGLFNYSNATKRSVSDKKTQKYITRQMKKYEHGIKRNSIELTKLMKKYGIKRNSIEPDNGYVLSPEELERFNKIEDKIEDQ